MRTILKTITIVILTIIILFSGAYVFMTFRGRAIITEQLVASTHKKVAIGYYRMTLPFNLELQQLTIKDFAKVERINTSVSLPRMLLGTLALNNLTITKPQIFVQRNPPAQAQLGAVSENKPEANVSVNSEFTMISNLRVIIKNLLIKDGNVDFIDNTTASTPIKITVKDINFYMTNLYTFPANTIANFKLSGNIPWQEGQDQGKIEAEGWMNFAKRDMQAVLKIKDIDGIYLYPYYSKWVDLEKARIEKAKLDFTANLQSLNNDLIAACHLELADIVRKPLAPEQSEQKASKIADAILGILKSLNQGKIVLDFNIRTKMDNPEFGIGDIKSAFEEKMSKARGGGGGIKPEYIIILPEKVVEGGIRGATDITRAVIDGVFAVGNEFKDAILGSFQKEPKESK